MKPGWLLDIDGVINAIGLIDFRTKWPDDEWIVTQLGPHEHQYPFRVAPSVRDFIGEMYAAGVDIRWHTTWQEGAEVAAEYLGLPTFPVHPAPEFRDWRYREAHGRQLGWWKLPSARRLLLDEEPDRPWIWTDDDLVSPLIQSIDPIFNDTCAAMRGDKIPANITSATRLLITPIAEYGLSPTQLATIRGFVIANS